MFMHIDEKSMVRQRTALSLSGLALHGMKPLGSKRDVDMADVRSDYSRESQAHDRHGPTLRSGDVR